MECHLVGCIRIEMEPSLCPSDVQKPLVYVVEDAGYTDSALDNPPSKFLCLFVSVAHLAIISPDLKEVSGFIKSFVYFNETYIAE